MKLSRARFAAFSVAASLSALAARAGAQTAPQIRVGTTANDSYAEPFYAHDEGLFERAGLDVEVQAFPNGAGVTTALAGNALDVGITNPISLANAVDHGLPFAFFAVAGTYNPEEVSLCVATGSSIRSAKDLEGKTVATNALKGSNSLEVSAWIDQNGGDSTKVRLVEMPFSAMAPAIRRGTVAAAEIAEPALSLARQGGGLTVLGHPMDAYGKRFMVGGWFARRDWLAANAPLVRRLAGVIYQTARWANAHPDESAAILAKYAKIDPGVVRTMNRARYGEAFGPALLQPYLDIGYKYGYLGRHFDARDLIATV